MTVKHFLGRFLQNIMETPTPPSTHTLAVKSAFLPALSAVDSAHTPDVESAFLPAHSAAESATTRTPIAVSALRLALHAVSGREREHRQLSRPAALHTEPAPNPAVAMGKQDHSHAHCSRGQQQQRWGSPDTARLSSIQ